MFTLAIYTQLAEPDLRDGRVIAGTGTIEQDGSVGDMEEQIKKYYLRLMLVQVFSLFQIIQWTQKF
jgi:hypothetical protein